jgi:RNA polymerase sigma factor (sigma-70 family)
VRDSFKPKLISADAIPVGQETGSLVDTIAGTDSPMDILLVQQEAADQRQQIAQLTAVLTQLLQDLEPEARSLLQSYYRDELTQTDIARQLGKLQYQVSRQLERIRRSLLKQITQWSQTTLHISPTPAVVDQMSHALEAWLTQSLKGE